MVFEGRDQPDLLEHGLAVARAIHDRYDARRRNPYNEVECSDHYSRAMASYGLFLAACGYEHHGPKGHLGFAPRVSPDDFRAAFTAAEGWGTFSQSRTATVLNASVTVKHGKVAVKTLALVPRDPARAGVVKAERVGDKLRPSAEVPATVRLDRDREGGRVVVTLGQDLTLTAGQTLRVTVSGA
jgi:hypothetical protein